MPWVALSAKYGNQRNSSKKRKPAKWTADIGTIRSVCRGEARLALSFSNIPLARHGPPLRRTRGETPHDSGRRRHRGKAHRKVKAPSDFRSALTLQTRMALTENIAGAALLPG